MSMGYDPEVPAGFQDADFEQREMEAEGNRLARLERAGICTHGSVVGIGADGVAHYPEAEGLTGDQKRCTAGCGEVFEDDADWLDARRAL